MCYTVTMTDALRATLEQALALSEEDRRLLALLLQELLEQGREPAEIPEWHKSILDQRLRDMEENPDDWTSLEDAEARLFKRDQDVA